MRTLAQTDSRFKDALLVVSCAVCNSTMIAGSANALVDEQGVVAYRDAIVCRTCAGPNADEVKKNPPIAIFSNPRKPVKASPFQREVGQLAGEIGEIFAIVYRHSETGELMVHGFGPDGDHITLKSLRDGVEIRGIDVTAKTGTFAYALKEGSGGRRTIRLAHEEGEPLWDNR